MRRALLSSSEDRCLVPGPQCSSLAYSALVPGCEPLVQPVPCRRAALCPRCVKAVAALGGEGWGREGCLTWRQVGLKVAVVMVRSGRAGCV